VGQLDGTIRKEPFMAVETAYEVDIRVGILHGDWVGGKLKGDILILFASCFGESVRPERG